MVNKLGRKGEVVVNLEKEKTGRWVGPDRTLAQSPVSVRQQCAAGSDRTLAQSPVCVRQQCAAGQQRGFGIGRWLGYDWRVRSPFASVARRCDRTRRGRVRSVLAYGDVSSVRAQRGAVQGPEASGQQKASLVPYWSWSDSGGVASGRFLRRVRSSLNDVSDRFWPLRSAMQVEREGTWWPSVDWTQATGHRAAFGHASPVSPRIEQRLILFGAL
jgi:hypothetical protein